MSVLSVYHGANVHRAFPSNSIPQYRLTSAGPFLFIVYTETAFAEDSTPHLESCPCSISCSTHDSYIDAHRPPFTILIMISRLYNIFLFHKIRLALSDFNCNNRFRCLSAFVIAVAFVFLLSVRCLLCLLLFIFSSSDLSSFPNVPILPQFWTPTPTKVHSLYFPG